MIAIKGTWAIWDRRPSDLRGYLARMSQKAGLIVKLEAMVWWFWLLCATSWRSVCVFFPLASNNCYFASKGKGIALLCYNSVSCRFKHCTFSECFCFNLPQMCISKHFVFLNLPYLFSNHWQSLQALVITHTLLYEANFFIPLLWAEAALLRAIFPGPKTLIFVAKDGTKSIPTMRSPSN